MTPNLLEYSRSSERFRPAPQRQQIAASDAIDTRISRVVAKREDRRRRCAELEGYKRFDGLAKIRRYQWAREV